MRRLPALLALLLLAACRPEGSDEPFTDSRIPPALPQAYWPPPSWAWGLLQVAEAPAVRYGVAAPATAPRGDLVIVAGHGESAEAWFETARDLSGRGYAVWVMDGLAQGGSGRFGGARDIAYAPDLAAEAQAIAALLKVVGRPAVLLAQSTAAPSALSAVSGKRTVKALILSAPAFDAADPPVGAGPVAGAGRWLAKAGFGWVRAVGQPRWRGTRRLPGGRAGIIPAWQQANPDLRMGGVSYGWIQAFGRQAHGLEPATLSRIAAPVTMLLPALSPPARARPLCDAMRRCIVRPVPGGRGPLHLEGDAARRAWQGVLDDQLAEAFPSTRPLEPRAGAYSLDPAEETTPRGATLQSR